MGVDSHVVTMQSSLTDPGTHTYNAASKFSLAETIAYEMRFKYVGCASFCCFGRAPQAVTSVIFMLRRRGSTLATQWR